MAVLHGGRGEDEAGDVEPGTAAPQIFGQDPARTTSVVAAVVTYRRDSHLWRTMASLVGQTLHPWRVLVVDNGSSPSVRRIVDRVRDGGLSAEYVDMGANGGPAGAMARAMDLVLEQAHDDTWLLRLDDDGELPWPQLLDEQLRFADHCVARDSRTAAVGVSGALFDWRSARLRKPVRNGRDGPLAVDYLATGLFPLYRVGAVRDAGVFRSDFFYGYEELEYGLRLRAAGYSLYRRDPMGPLPTHTGGPTWGSTSWRITRRPGWRDYYSLRNLLVILRSYGHAGTAARVALVRGLLKPLANLPLAPSAAAAHLRTNLRAVADAWRERLGCTWDPASGLHDGDELPLR